MRLSPDLLLQQVDDKLVFVDQSHGHEAVRPLDLETVRHLIDDVAVARVEGRDVLVDEVRVPPTAFDGLLAGLGYFIGGTL